MHNTPWWATYHNLDVFHTFGSNFDSVPSAFDCQQTMATMAWVMYFMSYFNTRQKSDSGKMQSLFFFQYKYSLQVNIISIMLAILKSALFEK